MTVELEREYTFLMTKLPANLGEFPSKIIEDDFIPASSNHPQLRIRRNGDSYVITKKSPETNGDSSRMIEHTIELSFEEYTALNQLPGKRLKKRRFAYQIDEYTAEVDVYLNNLEGLVLIDFEFSSDQAMADFIKPSFVGADITQDSLLAGGMLCGKAYTDIESYLAEKYDYKPLEGITNYYE